MKHYYFVSFYRESKNGDKGFSCCFDIVSDCLITHGHQLYELTVHIIKSNPGYSNVVIQNYILMRSEDD